MPATTTRRLCAITDIRRDAVAAAAGSDPDALRELDTAPPVIPRPI